MEPVDDGGDRGVGVGVQLLVTDADAFVVVSPAVLCASGQFQDVVPALADAGDRPERTPTRGAMARSRFRMPSAMVDFPVSPSGAAM